MRSCETRKAFQEGERSSIGGHIVIRGYGNTISLRDGNTGGSSGFLPAELLIDYIMLVTTEDQVFSI